MLADSVAQNSSMDPRLYCCESVGEEMTRAHQDPVLMRDRRVVQNLLLTEDKYLPNSGYFKCVQQEIQPCMRKTVAMWMLEICEEMKCEEEVFPLAMNYLDRYLSIVPSRKAHLQLLGAVCMFLASKLKDSNPLTAEKLCYYTENSINCQQLMDWEVYVLSRLKWDLSAVTAHDFLEHLMSRLQLTSDRADMVRRHAQTFIALCATDFSFAMYPPSMICAASIGAAAHGLLTSSSGTSAAEMNALLHRLSKLSNMEVDVLRSCIEQVEETVNTSLSTVDPLEQTPEKTRSPSASQLQPETPTDVREVHF
ncbi:PREDICTED: G1/S-specific cyclin-D2-like [Priapulus caudatus]|uniref:G1/S-specific cyclin-D2-like n=1 Tax=Priapulus caudatus TaxID=37621 RepID=A0ABM1E4N9_PRICU|nr:PREDICTED: G1/S-specific cyclin-D2-like [Priapulus caudatus]